MAALNQIKAILYSVLQIDESRLPLTTDSHLLGAVPEFDSMAVVSVITQLEDHFGIAINDDEIDASIFETVGTLVNFVTNKLA